MISLRAELIALAISMFISFCGLMLMMAPQIARIG